MRFRKVATFLACIMYNQDWSKMIHSAILICMSYNELTLMDFSPRGNFLSRTYKNHLSVMTRLCHKTSHHLLPFHWYAATVGEISEAHTLPDVKYSKNLIIRLCGHIIKCQTLKHLNDKNVKWLNELW